MIKIQSERLKYLQSLPLETKIELSKCAINEWYEYWDGQVYVSFSGGKDSTVLLDLVRSEFPEVKAMFINTGLEYPEILKFVKTIDNVDWIRPKKKFKDIIDKYGYPVISKEQSEFLEEYRTTKSDKLRELRWNGRSGSNSGKISEKWKFLVDSPFKISDMCCEYIKKQPAKKYEIKTKLHPFVGNMADESSMRKHNYQKHGCNAFEIKRPISRPLGIWLEKDIWDYVRLKNLPYSSIYDRGYDRTGCMFCMFGVHLEKEPNRFQRMKINHPKHYKYCIETLGLGKVLDFINVKY